MGKVKNMNLVMYYAFLAAAFMIAAMFIADFEREYIEGRQMEVAQKYTHEVEIFNEYKVWDKQGKGYLFSKEDSNKIRRLDFFYYIFPHMAYICSGLLASFVCYQMKLKKPLHILSHAAERIAENDLNFQIKYDREDEFGKLCDAFEKMRWSLEESNRDVWRQMEDRRRLNASFSHDLRTPLTVLEGHMEILQKYSMQGALSEEDMKDIYSVMKIQINRMNRYVSSMSELQRLEDIPISYKKIRTEELIRALGNTAEIICASKRLSFVNKIRTEDVTVDLEIVLQVCENLLSNAVRYAKESVEVICKKNNHMLVITVIDDGKGFLEKEMKIATDPFYTTEKKSEGEHFGLGLNICKILCQRHGGNISLENEEGSGARITVIFGMKESTEKQL